MTPKITDMGDKDDLLKWKEMQKRRFGGELSGSPFWTVKFKIPVNYPSGNIDMSLEFGKEIWAEYKFGKI